MLGIAAAALDVTLMMYTLTRAACHSRDPARVCLRRPAFSAHNTLQSGASPARSRHRSAVRSGWLLLRIGPCATTTSTIISPIIRRALLAAAIIATLATLMGLILLSQLTAWLSRCNSSWGEAYDMGRLQRECRAATRTKVDPVLADRPLDRIPLFYGRRHRSAVRSDKSAGSRCFWVIVYG